MESREVSYSEEEWIISIELPDTFEYFSRHYAA